ncbi:MAG TPA: ESX secretion-associated protein EspG [Pseudonocardiaceae bacterium]|nr:ESX secretion-associated protein EspG [Pseudonocardiaceae bacterium]
MTTTELGVTTGEIRLSTVEFDVLWEHLGLGEIPLVLKVPSPGRTRGERAELVERAWRSLSQRDLGRPTGLNSELDRLLRLLVRPQREIDGRLWIRLRSFRLLVAASGADAVFATLADDQITLRPAESSGLVREALSPLPQGPAGPGESVTLPSADLEAAAAESETPEDFERRLCERGVRHRDAAALRTMVTNARRQGQFGAAARDRWGRRSRAGRVVSFFDNPKGRYLQMRRVAPSGEAWSTISPADHRLLLTQLADLLTEVETDANAR